MLKRLYIDNYKCYLASSQGIWFERENNGPVRAKPITESGENGLSISELVARGWIDENPLLVSAPPSLQIAITELQRIL